MDKQIAYDIPLHDIKPLVGIEDYSLYYFIATVSASIVVVFFIIYYLFKWIKKRKKFNIRLKHKEHLEGIDFQSSKDAAYKITMYAHTFKDDSEILQNAYEKLVEQLEKYKYKKDVDKFDEETIKLIDSYKSLVHV